MVNAGRTRLVREPEQAIAMIESYMWGPATSSSN
jgi:hypothetical protein